MEWWAYVLIGGFSASLSLTIGIARAILNGDLVPRKQTLDLKEDRDNWRRLALVNTRQINQLLPASDVAVEILQQLPVQTQQKDVIS